MPLLPRGGPDELAASVAVVGAVVGVVDVLAADGVEVVLASDDDDVDESAVTVVSPAAPPNGSVADCSELQPAMTATVTIAANRDVRTALIPPP